ncbi:MAG: hypothetical protein JNK72_22945 [Myxococcales bacterium]|nr:hypothetical protein [Myxococcales bacterium]
MKQAEKLALLSTFLVALAGCTGASVVGGPGGDASTGTDVQGSDADVATLDTGNDTGGNDTGGNDTGGNDSGPVDAGPTRCMSNNDCMGNAAGGVCNTMTGQCVQCLGSETCEAGQYCDTATSNCVRGCRDDNACNTAMGGGGGGDDAGTGAMLRCNPMTRTCVECYEDAQCPAGTLCRGNSCVRGCTDSSRCAMGESCCAGACVNTQSNADNCGTCGTVCNVPNAQAACAMGQCAVGSCTGDRRDCDNMVGNGCETDTNSSLMHCGGCGRVCNTPPNATASCTAGSCGFTCVTGFADCDNDPANGCETDLNSSADNCGTCGTRCMLTNATAACMAGRCAVAACANGFGDCDTNAANGCETNIQTSTSHCGTCGSACAMPSNGAAACTMGSCGIAMCGAGFADCDGNTSNGCETNTQTSATHCGACGAECRLNNATASCAAGACAVATCTTGFANCDNNAANGCEVNTRGDVNNCGACGTVCAASNGTPSCNAGACTVGSCNDGFANCDSNNANGCETNTQTDTNNCGACRNTCNLANASSVCRGGSCAIGTCNAGFADCDGNAANGCETNTNTSLSACGMCGRVCNTANGTPVCTNGACGVGACDTGFANCDNNAANGCEVVVQSDIRNCGSCGRVCPTPSNGSAVCTLGQCGIGTCTSGTADCDNNTANGCETNTNTSVLNCGACGRTCPTLPNASTTCTGGLCGLGACATGFANCDNNPTNGCETNLTNTVGSCGACGRACSFANASATCANSTCALGTCNAGFANCDGNAANGCETNINTTLAACGACGRVCAAPTGGSATCTGGTCVQACPAGQSNCGGVCRPTGAACTSAGTGGCAQTGTIVCSGTTTTCSAVPRTSGTCTAPAGGTCGAGGVCACPTGQTNCSNTCRALTTDVNNCGACGRICTAPTGGSVTCANSTCVQACPAGQSNCGGVCRPTGATCTSAGTGGCAQTGTLVCSGTTTACSAVPRTSGTCTAPAGGTCGAGGVCACPTGQTNCSNTCRTLTTDNANCGACGRACGTNQACVAGVCVGQGSLRFTLTWDRAGDMDLHLLPPCGTEIYYGRLMACGGTLDRDDTSATGPENIFWSSSYTPGQYVVCPEAYNSAAQSANWTLVVVRNGVEVARRTGVRNRVDGNTVCSTSFPGAIVLNL